MNKKKIILTIITIILFVVVFFLAYLLFFKYVLKRNFESDILSFANKNQNTVFKIDNITFFIYTVSYSLSSPFRITHAFVI